MKLNRKVITILALLSCVGGVTGYQGYNFIVDEEVDMEPVNLQTRALFKAALNVDSSPRMTAYIEETKLVAYQLKLTMDEYLSAVNYAQVNSKKLNSAVLDELAYRHGNKSYKDLKGDMDNRIAHLVSIVHQI